MIPKRHFYMIRHGQTEANAARIMAGSIDSPLTEMGKSQARELHKVIETLKIKPSKIIHSQLSRARDTATIINEILNLPMIEDADYAEMHAGEWEGVPYDDCPQLLKDWVDPPGGESCQQFFDRVKRAKIRALHHEEETEYSPVMVVCHGGVFRAFLKLHNIHIEGVRNCVLYEFEPHEIEDGFPWRVWRYDIADAVTRTELILKDHDPASEIAE
jgi:broad specificity phosphatase PhoE